MKQTARLTSFLILVSLVTGGVFISPGAINAQAEVSEKELEAINQAINEVQAEIRTRNAERDSVYTQMLDAEQNLARLDTEIAGIESSITASETRLNNLTDRRAGLQEKRTLQRDLIARYIRSAYQTGRQEYLKLLLNQEDPSLTARSLRYYSYFNDARSQQVQAWSEIIEEIQAVEEEISLSTQRLETQQETLVSQQLSYRSAKQQRQNLLDELDVLLSRSGKRLESLESERTEMELLLEELRRSIANLSLGDQEQEFASLKGRLPWPTDGRMQNSWGSSYGLGDLNWEGVTIAAGEGSNVHAIHHGRVVFSDWFSTSGLLLIIDHGDGYMSLYAHNQALFKDVGEWVTSGETIASVGNTGGQSDFGLYFEIRHNGESVNPSNWCVARN